MNQSTCIDIVPSMDQLKLVEEKSCNAEGREDIHDGFFICDLGNIVKKYQEWVKTFPRIVPYYAVKCNRDSAMLKMLVALGLGFDCASKEEIRNLLELGAQPTKIIYANPCKQESHIRYSRDKDVKLVVVDSEEELIKMKANFPDAELVLRIQTNDLHAVIPMSKKFGANLKLSYHLIDTASEIGLKMIGICFHVGNQCPNSQLYLEALKDARALFEYAETVGYTFNLLDIGGGFSGIKDANVKFEDIAPIVNQHVDELFPKDKFKHVRVIAEPGRFFTESAFTLATNIIAKKKVTRSILLKDTGDHADERNENHSTSLEEPAFKYFTNEGVHGSFNFLLHGFDTPLPILLKPAPKESATFLSSVLGPTLNAHDRILKRHMLPELNVADWLVWQNMGAYTSSLSCPFNGFLLSSTYYMISKSDFAIFRNLTHGKDTPGLVWKESDT